MSRLNVPQSTTIAPISQYIKGPASWADPLLTNNYCEQYRKATEGAKEH